SGEKTVILCTPDLRWSPFSRCLIEPDDVAPISAAYWSLHDMGRAWFRLNSSKAYRAAIRE
ncbi:TPA: hypothetical protein ACK3Q6_003639, partial [Burkholderia cepacia]